MKTLSPEGMCPRQAALNRGGQAVSILRGNMVQDSMPVQCHLSLSAKASSSAVVSVPAAGACIAAEASMSRS